MPLTNYWPLQEDSGSTAYDVRGSSNGTVNGATVGQGGLLGNNAYSFDGSGDDVDTGVGELSGAFTVSAWIYPQDVSSNQRPVTNDTGSSDGQFSLVIRDTSKSRFYIRDSGGGFSSIDGPSLGTGDWYHFVGVFDDNQNMRHYLDGDNHGEVSVGTTLASTSQTVHIGDDSSDSHVLDGRVCHVELWDHALSHGAIQYLYEVGAGNGYLTTDMATV